MRGLDTLSPKTESYLAKFIEVSKYEAIHKSLRVFRPGSLLHHYLAKRKKDLITLSTATYRISTILLALREIIEEDQLYDPRNLSIIVLNKELEQALEVSVLSTSQMRARLEMQLLLRFGNEPVQSMEQAQKELDAMNFWFSACTDDGEPVRVPKSEFRAGVLCKMTPQMKDILQTVSSEQIKNRTLPYDKICCLMSKYILSNQHQFFDLRNTKIAKVKGSPLEKLFGVSYFARSQIVFLIRHQLTIVQPAIKRLTRSQAKLP